MHATQVATTITWPGDSQWEAGYSIVDPFAFARVTYAEQQYQQQYQHCICAWAKDISGLYTASQGINLMDDLWRTESSINAIRPAIVALHIGSNDLSNLTSINGETAKWLARRGLDFANYICTQYGVVKVLMFSTLPRTAGLSCTPEEFRENMGTFNKEIEIHCDNNRLNYVHVRGFYCTKINNLDVPRPVRDWSGDGIHCDMEKSKKKYAQRVRFAIMNASSAIQ